MQNSEFDPKNIADFEKTKLNKDAKGISGTAIAGQTTNFDLIVNDDILLAGGSIFLAKGAAIGDNVDFQIVHPIYGVLNQFVTSWYINPDSTKQDVPSSNYPAKIFAGLTLRVKYHSVGETDVWVAINYNVEKIIV